MIDTPLGQPLARGRTADIHAWEAGQVLKLFHDWFHLDNIQYEARIAAAVHASGLPVPRAGAIVRVNGRNGLIYERIDGPAMLDVLQRKPWQALHFGRCQAALHAAMHASAFAPDIPSQRQRLETKICRAAALPAPLQAAALKALAAMPGGDRLCHGDFHPGNILLAAQGEAIIDWIDATRGNPLADVARSTIIALGAAASDQMRGLLAKALVRSFHAAYIRRYFRLRPGGQGEYQRWLPIVAAARLSENIPELEQWLLRQVGQLSR